MKELASEGLGVFKKVLKYVLILFLVLIGCLVIKYTCLQFIQNIDENVFSYIKEHLVDERLTNVMKYITMFGSQYVFLPLLICIIFGLRDKRYGIFMTMNLVWVFIINYILKSIFMRPRPVSLLVSDISGFSFPSSHVMCSVAFYGLLYILIKRNVKSKSFNVCFLTFLTLLIATIGFSRVYLQVHYLSDVIMGIIYGLLCLGTFVTILKVIDNDNKNLEVKAEESEIK